MTVPLRRQTTSTTNPPPKKTLHRRKTDREQEVSDYVSRYILIYGVGGRGETMKETHREEVGSEIAEQESPQG